MKLGGDIFNSAHDSNANVMAYIWAMVFVILSI